MVYIKNVPAWERFVRIVAGIAGLTVAAMNWGSSGLAVGAGLTGAGLALTGLAGFCPMCALAGRKLKAGR